MFKSKANNDEHKEPSPYESSSSVASSQTASSSVTREMIENKTFAGNLDPAFFRGKELRNCIIRDAVGPGMDYPFEDVRLTSTVIVNCHDCRFRKCTFTYCTLRGGLIDTVFEANTRIIGSDLSRAWPQDAHFHDSSIKGSALPCRLSGSSFRNCQLTQVKIPEGTFRTKFWMENSLLQGELNGFKLNEGILTNCTVRDSDLSNAELDHVTVAGGRMEECTGNNVKFADSTFDGVDMNETVFPHVKAQGTVFKACSNAGTVFAGGTFGDGSKIQDANPANGRTAEVEKTLKEFLNLNDVAALALQYSCGIDVSQAEGTLIVQDSNVPQISCTDDTRLNAQLEGENKINGRHVRNSPSIVRVADIPSATQAGTSASRKEPENSRGNGFGIGG